MMTHLFVADFKKSRSPLFNAMFTQNMPKKLDFLNYSNNVNDMNFASLARQFAFFCTLVQLRCVRRALSLL